MLVPYRMKPVYLHIGLPRTGTTALQHWLQQHARALAERDVFTFDQMALAHRLSIESLGEPQRHIDADVLGIAGHELSAADHAHPQTPGSVHRVRL